MQIRDFCESLSSTINTLLPTPFVVSTDGKNIGLTRGAGWTEYGFHEIGPFESSTRDIYNECYTLLSSIQDDISIALKDPWPCIQDAEASSEDQFATPKVVIASETVTIGYVIDSRWVLGPVTFPIGDME